MTNSKTEILQDHEKLISTINLLPEIPIFAKAGTAQIQEIKSQQRLWHWIGKRIDYLQRMQLGFWLDDPTKQLEPPILRTKIIVHSDCFFSLLQVLIDGFDIVKSAAEKSGQEFPYHNPRELLAAICKENAQSKVEEITSSEIGNGSTISQIRKEQSLMGKFYRGSLSDEEAEEFCIFFESCGLWTGFVLASIYRATGKRYLKKWHSWQQFTKSHKAYCKYLNNSQTSSIKWEAGHPVWADTSKPVLYEKP